MAEKSMKEREQDERQTIALERIGTGLLRLAVAVEKIANRNDDARGARP